MIRHNIGVFLRRVAGRLMALGDWIEGAELVGSRSFDMPPEFILSRMEVAQREWDERRGMSVDYPGEWVLRADELPDGSHRTVVIGDPLAEGDEVKVREF